MKVMPHIWNDLGGCRACQALSKDVLIAKVAIVEAKKEPRKGSQNRLVIFFSSSAADFVLEVVDASRLARPKITHVG